RGDPGAGVRGELRHRLRGRLLRGDHPGSRRARLALETSPPARPLAGLAGVFYQVYYRVDILILEHLRGAASVGVYALAYGLVDQSRAFFALLAMSLFPVMVRRRSEQGGFPTVMGLGVLLGVGAGIIAIVVVWL